MPHPYLPKLRTGSTFAEPTTTKKWEHRARKDLESLADSIEIPPAAHRIHSIPDPWARAILFERALYSPEHVLHPTVLGEWRGMLALIGLRERRRFIGLSTTAVSLVDPKAGTFSSVLANLKPSDNDLISSSTGWDPVYLFRWQRQTGAQGRSRSFGFSSPTTLVCTGADYESILSSDEVPWFNQGPDNRERRLLRDPSAYLGNRERRALAEWILLLALQLNGFDSGPRRNVVSRALKAYADHLDPSASVPVEAESLSNTSLGLHQGIYRVLDRPRKGDESTGSDVEIFTTRKNAPRYLLVDPSIAQQWNVDAKDVTVYRDVTLATAQQLTSTGRPEIEPGLAWCTPQFFFTDRLIYDPNPTAAFRACLPVKFTGAPYNRSVVLPLAPEVLQLFTAHELAERLTIEWLPGGGATCHLHLLLRRADGAHRPVRIHRTYSDAEMTSIANLPLVGIWPDMRIDGVDWKTYFTFQFWGANKEELSVRPWSEAERQPLAHRKHALDSSRRFQAYRSGTFPEALICETPYYDETQHRESVARGILLLQQPTPHTPAPGQTTVLGIDFGSTGTNVYVSSGGARPEAIMFKARVRQITDFDTGKFFDACRDLFVPQKDWPAESILSVFHDFGDPPEGDVARLVLRDGHVLYADDPNKFIAGDRKRVVSNLKWGAERERICARDFLMQICLQAAAEVAYQGTSSVDVRFSYPTAFSARDQGQFLGHWTEVTRRVSELTGVSFTLNEDIDNREAVTATRFFVDRAAGNKERMDVVGGAVTMDIGGGTTDVAVWKDVQLLAHNSVVMAGRDIFLMAVRRRPDILNEIDPQIPLESLKGGQRDPAFHAQLDAIVARHGEAMIKALAVRQARPSVQGLLMIIETGLCGLLFFSGLLLRRLIENGEFKAGSRMGIHVGGNGSKLFRWCALGAPIAKTEIHERGAMAFAAGAGLKDLRVAIHLSPAPKSEVAYGLVADSIQLQVTDNFSQPLAGDAFHVGGDNKTWNDTLMAADIRAKRVKVNRDFPIFRQFLDSIEHPVDEELLYKLGVDVDLRFNELAQEIEKAEREEIVRVRRGSGAIRNEPIFIMALKRLLESEIDEWERRS